MIIFLNNFNLRQMHFMIQFYIYLQKKLYYYDGKLKNFIFRIRNK